MNLSDFFDWAEARGYGVSQAEVRHDGLLPAYVKVVLLSPRGSSIEIKSRDFETIVNEMAGEMPAPDAVVEAIP